MSEENQEVVIEVGTCDECGADFFQNHYITLEFKEKTVALCLDCYKEFKDKICGEED